MELTMNNFVREFERMVSMKDQHGMVFGYMPDMLIVPPSAFSDALDCVRPQNGDLSPMAKFTLVPDYQMEASGSFVLVDRKRRARA